MSGGGSVASLLSPINQLTVATVAASLPIWTEWGVHDTGPLIHSLGVTFLTTLGRDLGYISVSEMPAPRSGSPADSEIEVRSDAVWFDQSTRRVALIAEFERYSGKQKDLTPKAESLLRAHHRWNCDEAVLLLTYWSIGVVTLPSHDHLRTVIRDGFSATGGVHIPGSPRAQVVFYQFIVREGQDGLLRLSEIIRRGET